MPNILDFDWFIWCVAVNAAIVIALALNVSYRRITLRVANGDGGKKEMKAAIRAHGNGVEHVTIFALIVLALELANASTSLLATVVIAFSVGRVLHAFSMLTSAFQVRRLAAALTYLAEVGAVLALLVEA